MKCSTIILGYEKRMGAGYPITPVSKKQRNSFSTIARQKHGYNKTSQEY
jgi:hypothetical protein